MSGITNYEFMVKGYHYTEPTSPIRTDSCRLYLDIDIDGEESNVENDVWEVPSTACLDVSNKVEEIRADLVPNSTNLVWTLTLNQYIDTSAMAYITLPGATASVGGRFLSHDWYYEPENTAVINITYTMATRELVMTLSNWSDDYASPTIRYIVGDGFRIHLKGIHGFYFQT